MKKTILITAFLSVALSGCATSGASKLYEDPYSYRQGWRKGIVSQPPGRDFFSAKISLDCRADKQLSAHSNFATVKYYHLEYWRTGIFPIEKGREVEPGDSVYVNILDCRLPMVKQKDIQNR